MVGYQGEKMSKSLGNLVFLRDLLERLPAAVIRLVLCAHHRRTAWEYTDGELAAAQSRWLAYRSAITSGAGLDSAAAQGVRDDVLARLDDDLDTPGAIAVLDAAAARLAEPGAPSGGHVSAAQLLAPLPDPLRARIAPRRETRRDRGRGGGAPREVGGALQRHLDGDVVEEEAAEELALIQVRLAVDLLPGAAPCDPWRHAAAGARGRAPGPAPRGGPAGPGGRGGRARPRPPAGAPAPPPPPPPPDPPR